MFVAAAVVVLSIFPALPVMGVWTGDVSLREIFVETTSSSAPWLPTRKLLQSPLPTARLRGKNAPCGRYPYMVSLRDFKNKHNCGGVLISSQWVLTAAHCVDPSQPGSPGPNLIIVIGACNLDDDINEGDGVERMVPEEVFLHPEWNGTLANGGDLALLKLKAPSELAYVNLPSKLTKLAGDQFLVALGWGNLPNDTQPNRLQQTTNLRLLENKFCRAEEVWGDVIKDTMFCAIGPDSSEVTCGADSGGPVLLAFAPEDDVAKGVPDLDILMGITSFGERVKSCEDARLPGVYTKVHPFLNWITDVQDGTNETDSEVTVDTASASRNQTADDSSSELGLEPDTVPDDTSANIAPSPLVSQEPPRQERDNSERIEPAAARSVEDCLEITNTTERLRCVIEIPDG